MLKVTDYLKLD